MPPGGLPDAFLESGEDPVGFLLVRFARGRGPFTTAEAAARFGLDGARDARTRWRASSGAGRLVRGELRPGGHRAGVVRSRRPAPAPARDARPPAKGGRAGRAGGARRASSRPGRGSIAGRACGRRSCRSRASLSPFRSGSRTSCRGACPATGPSSSTSSAPPARSSGSAPGSSGWPSTTARTRRCSDARRRFLLPGRGRPSGSGLPSAAGAFFWHDLLDAYGSRGRGWRCPRSGSSSGPARSRTTRGSRCGRPPLRDAAPAKPVPDGGGSRARAARRPPRRRGAGRSPPGCSPARPTPRALAELLLERQGIVTRDGVRAEGVPGGYAPVYRGTAKARDGRRLPARLLRRGARRCAVRAARRRRAPARAGRRRRTRALVLAAADPAQPYGAALPWPKRAGGRASRVAGALVVTARRRARALRRARRTLDLAAPRAGGGLAAPGARRARRPCSPDRA